MSLFSLFKKKEENEKKFSIKDFQALSRVSKQAQPYYSPAEEFKKQIELMRDTREILEDFNDDERTRIAEEIKDDEGDDMQLLKTLLPALLGAKQGSKPTPEQQNPEFPVTFGNLTDEEKSFIDKKVVTKIPKPARAIFKTYPADKQKDIIKHILDKLQE